MQTIKLEVEDSKVELVLNIIKSLKKNIVSKYEVISDTNESSDFTEISLKSFEDIWGNKEDAEYDSFIKI